MSEKDCDELLSGLESQHDIMVKKGHIDFKGMSAAKIDKLLHYSERSLTEFNQFDVFTEVEPGDPIVKPDKDGDSVFGGSTKELMTGAPTVRVLILPGASPEAIKGALKKITSWIEKEPRILTQYINDTDPF